MSHYRLPFLDSFDHYGTSHNTRKWTFGCGSIVTGRHGNGCTGDAKTAFAIDYGDLAVGCAYKTAAYSNSPIAVGSGYAWAGTHMVRLEHLSDGRLRVRLVHGAIMTENLYSAASDFVMHLNTFYYLELLVQIGEEDGGERSVTYQARVNEETVCSGTFEGVVWDWGSMNLITLTPPGGGVGAVFDDVYATEGELLGDVRIGVIRPNGAGAYSQWSPQPAGDHYDQVNDLTPDDASSYLKAASAGLKETHEYEDISVSGDIKCIQTLVCLKKSDAGSAQTKSLLRSGAGDEDQGLVFYPSEESYFYDRKGYVLNPWTGLAWTESDINSLQFGLSREV